MRTARDGRDRPCDFGLFRMYGTLFELHVDGSAVGVFTTLDDAIEWVTPWTGYIDRLMDARPLWEGEAFLEKPFSVAGFREAVSILLYGTLRH